MKTSFNLKKLIICIAIPLATGGIASFITANNMNSFSALNMPPFSPPKILFPIVWTILYILMGISSYLVLSSNESYQNVKNALTVYIVQLGVNFLWPILFFNLKLYSFSFLWFVLLWLLIIYNIVLFYKIYKPTIYLLIPYLLWVTFASYLNLGIAMLN